MLTEEDVLQLLVPKLPKNSKILGVQWKAEYLGFFVAVENSEFEPIQVNVQIPFEVVSVIKGAK